MTLYLRSALCALGYVVLWGVFALLDIERRDLWRAVDLGLRLAAVCRWPAGCSPWPPSIWTSATACSIMASIWLPP